MNQNVCTLFLTIIRKMEISFLNFVKCQDKRVAYYLSRAELISLLVKEIRTQYTAVAVQNYMHLNPSEKVLVTERVKKF